MAKDSRDKTNIIQTKRERYFFYCKLISISLLVIGCLWFCHFMLDRIILNNSDYAIKEIKISGLSKIIEQDLRMTSIYKDIEKSEIQKKQAEVIGTLESFYDKNLFTISTKDIRTSLEKLPLIQTVEVRRIFPNKLIIDIRERRLIAVLANGLTVDDQKCLGPQTEEAKYLPRLIWKNKVVNTLRPGDKLPKELEELLKVLSFINTNKTMERLTKIDIITLIYEEGGLDPIVRLYLRQRTPFKQNAELLLPLNKVKYTYQKALEKVDAIIENHLQNKQEIEYLDATLSNYLNIR